MPDLILLLKAGGVSAATAAAVLLVVAWRSSGPTRPRLGAVLGTGAGFLAGCLFLGLGPRWPALEDRDRFLVVLLPLVLLVEAVAAPAAVPRWLAWLLRLAVAAAAAPILLYQTSYLADLAGPGTAEWSPGQARLVLSSLAAVLAVTWGVLALLPWRVPGPRTTGALALACGTAGVCVMLSGYMMGGQLGFPLAGALAGVATLWLCLPATRQTAPPVGVGLVGLFAILVLGRFIGALTTMTALYLLAAPLLSWAAEGPGLGRLGPRTRDAVALLLVALPLLVVAASTHRQFEADSAAPSNYFETGQ